MAGMSRVYASLYREAAVRSIYTFRIWCMKWSVGQRAIVFPDACALLPVAVKAWHPSRCFIVGILLPDQERIKSCQRSMNRRGRIDQGFW